MEGSLVDGCLDSYVERQGQASDLEKCTIKVCIVLSLSVCDKWNPTRTSPGPLATGALRHGPPRS